MIVKEMKYSGTKPVERIAEGRYKGFDFYVLSFGSHPCAYIDVSNTSLARKHYDDIGIDCHGGLTYSENQLVTVDKKGWFIGWDYAHLGDYYRTPYNSVNGKQWTTGEIVEECINVIEQIHQLLES